MSYLLDANVFMQAKNHHYGFDFCPAFWQWILDNGPRGGSPGRVASIDKVADGITVGTDKLAVWARSTAPGLFRATDAPVAARFGEVAGWANRQQYEQPALFEFFRAADFYLVAHALAGGHTVVTHEVASNSPRRSKIPNVCAGLGLRCMNPFQMLRAEQARFVLGPP